MTKTDTNKIKVFLLTEEWRDQRGKTELLFFGKSENGQPVEIIINNFRPVFFVENSARIPSSNILYQRKKLKLKNFDDQPVDALYFNSQYDMKNFETELRKAGISVYESDINPSQRYLMERFINLGVEVEGNPEEHSGTVTYINPKMKPVEFLPELKITSLDIETSGDGGTLYSIAFTTQLGDETFSKVMMLDQQSIWNSENIEFYSTEMALMLAFMEYIKTIDPDVIIGWHVIGFDLMFLEKKCEQLNINFNISRGNSRHLFRKRTGRNYFAYIPGRLVFDGPPSLRSAFYNFTDYRLETVAQNLLGTGKSIAGSESKVDEIERQFREEKEQLAEYNLLDTKLVMDIFNKTGIIDQSIKRGILSGLFLDRLGMMSAAFDHFMLPRIHRAGYVSINVEDIKQQGHAAGGFVFNPVPGIYENVAVFDFKSLYPSIIRTFKIDPYSRLKSDINSRETPNGYKFSYTENFLPDFIAQLMNQRQEAKEKNDKYLSQAVKILMNSFYGVMGSYGCRFYHPSLPSAITGTGKWLLLNCREHLETLGYNTIYGDTDSLFVELKKNESRQVAVKLGEKLNKYLAETLKKKFDVTSYLELEFEKLYSKYVLTSARSADTGAKKRYAGLLIEGDQEKLEFVGMEFVRSDWTQLAKDFQSELYLKYLHGEEIQSWIRELVQELKKGKLDEKLIYKKRLRRDIDSYVKNVPPHIKAARMLNRKEDYIEYYISKQGPVPIQLAEQNIDYDHYIEKQIKPIADSLLSLTGKTFDEILNPKQFNFFD